MAPPLDDTWTTMSGRDALFRFAREPAAALTALESAVAVSRRDVTLVRRSCADTLRLMPLPDVDPMFEVGHTDRSDRDRTAIVFAGQFSVDVSATDDALRARLTSEYRRDSFGLVQMVWIADMVPRLRAALDRLFRPPAGGWPTADPVESADPWPLVEEFNRVVYNLHEIDPVTSEVVRLRGARQHHCRLCRSLRSQPALAAGATEALFDAIDSADHTSPDISTAGPLSDRHRAALALTDAMIWTPATIDDRVVEAVRDHFSAAEAVELALDVMRNAANKIAVSLGADEARVAEGTEVYDIDEDGTMRFQLDAST